MARARLTDAEREQRRRERVAYALSDAAYTHYDPKTTGYGSAEDWLSQADHLLSGRGALKEPRANVSPYAALLKLFGLEHLPETAALLKRAYRNMLFVVHPDYGGTTADAQALNAAFAKLIKLY